MEVVFCQVLTDSLAMEWTPARAAWLKKTEGVESVIDAVKRTQTPQVKAQTPAVWLHRGL